MQKQVLRLAILSFLGFWCHADGPITPGPAPALPPNSNYEHCEGALFPEPSCCGLHMQDLNQNAAQLSERIYGGRETRINEFPWLVYINITKVLVNGIPDYCAGSLINTRWVLSAAHCFVNPDVNLPNTIPLNIGEWNIETEKDCEYGDRCAPEVVIVNVDKIFPHEQYRPHNQNHLNDIALLRLSRPIHYSDFIQPICLPWDGLLNDEHLIGKIADVAGWGRTEYNSKGSAIKMKAKVKVQNQSACSVQSSKYPFNNLFRPNQIAKIETAISDQVKETQICAGGIEEVDACHGDSGGPLMMQLYTTTSGGHFPSDSNSYYQIGLVSYSEFCGVEGKPGVYTRISSYLKWIRDTMRRNS